ncbi:MAG: DsbA family protein [Peptococcaceae bacterium]|nr:DsbA family protein [Peptococcaceae bacterium]
MFHELHEAIFHAYFTAGKEIGLDDAELKAALTEQRYAPRLEQAKAEGNKYGITGTPTFIVNDQQIIVGAQPLEAFRTAFAKLSNGEKSTT